MNISEFFIRRPVATTLLMATVAIFGIMAYLRLPISDLPSVDFPTINVQAGLPGATPDEMASAVATPLEKQFTEIAGLLSMSSQSSQGSTSITLQFDLSRNIDDAAQDVNAAISRAAGSLPHNMPSPPSYQKVNPAASPVYILAVTSDSLPIYTVDNYAENLLGDSISEISGVAEVSVFGSTPYAVRIQADPQALAARGIGIDQLVNTIQNGNPNLPTGILNYGKHTAYNIYTNGQLSDAAEYRKLIVAYQNGVPVHLDEVANVLDSVEDNQLAAWCVTKPAVVLAIELQPGANTVATVDAIKALVPKLALSIPHSIQLTPIFDHSVDIRYGVQQVKFTLLMALILVVIVIFGFLRTLRATIIPSIAMPFAIVGTFAMMYELNYTIDYFSLLALTLSVGFIIDDAVVMLENCYRHIEMGQPPMEATLQASREIGFTIISMTLSLAAIFIPILFLSGIIGRLLQEFAMTLAIAILFSGVISLTLTPMMCSRFLKPPGKKHNFLYKLMEHFFEASLRIYQKMLRFSLRMRLFVLIGSFFTLLLTLYLLVTIPESFIPAGDSGRIRITTQASQSISFDDMVRHQLAAATIVAADPNVETFMSFCSGNSGRLLVTLKPNGPRKLTTNQVLYELRNKLSKIVGINCYLQNMLPVNINGRYTNGEFQFVLLSPDEDDLYKYSPILLDKLSKVKGIVDVNSDLEIQADKVTVQVDRQRAESLGVSADAVEEALSYAYGATQISTIYDPEAEYEVIMELLPKDQQNPQDLSQLYITSSSGTLVPLSAVSNVVKGVGPLQINHTGELSSVTISFDLGPGMTLSQAVADVQSLAKATLPDTIVPSFSGEAQQFQAAVVNMGELLLVSVVVIYIILGMLYESFIHPITILTALPFAGLGALLALMLFGKELDLYAFVGLIMLVGLVKKNGIIMVDFAIDAQRHQGLAPEEAIFQACSIRFRPIMMTTMAALLGTLPIALSSAGEAGTRQPLGIAVVGGLLFSQFLTLFVTPVFYIYMDKVGGFFIRNRKESGGNGNGDVNGNETVANEKFPLAVHT
ncbi:MAG TPA: efflux RND transporter permease subunit [Phycisphaerae bacterium]|nr:efflux RND transporter permease subunit [Phycisphaerae bacterium]